VHIFIELIVKAIINFYGLEVKQGEMKRDLVVNLATNQILVEDLYFLIFNFYAGLQKKEILLISEVLGNKELVEDKLSLETLKVKH
jgi:hypothetical protein